MRKIYRYPLIAAGLIAGTYLGFRYVFVYFIPFVLGGILACILDPLVNQLEERAQFKRGYAVLIALSLMLVVLLMLMVLVVSGLYVELNTLVHELPDYRKLVMLFTEVFEHNDELFVFLENLELPQTVLELIDDNIHALYNSLQDLLLQMINTTLNTLKTLPRLMLILVISCIAAFFFSRDKRLIRNVFFSAVPPQWSKQAHQVYSEFTTSVLGFVRAELTMILITTTVATIGLYLIGSEYALVMGFTAGILDLIPLIGPSLLFVPVALVSLLMGNIRFAVSLLVLLSVMAILRQMAEARIVGAGIGIHPLLTLIAIYVGIQLFGVSGVFVGPLILITFKSVFKAGIITLHK